jgi:molecular chaperone GrpE
MSPVSKPPDEDAPPPSDVKVVDRRWWARGESTESTETSAKPTYVEELEARLAEKDRTLQSYVEQYKSATSEFEAARARARREVAREVERGKRAILIDLLDIVDNLDRAIEAARTARTAPAEGLLHGVEMVRTQFLGRLEAFGVAEIKALGERFDPQLHEAVSVVPCESEEDRDRVLGIVRRGYRVGDEVLRPALVAVAKPA